MDPPLYSRVKLAVSWVDSYPKKQTSTDKVLAFIFWNVQIILFIDYLEKRTINSKYYIYYYIYVCFEGRNCQKTATNEGKNVLFHQDDAPCHKLIAMITKLHELHFKLLLHPPYSPDLAPSDYWLLADLERIPQGKRFGSNKVKLETEVKDKLFYKKVLNC